MRKKFRRSISSAAKWSPRLGRWAILALIVVVACHRFEVIEADAFFVGASFTALLAVAGLGLAAQGFVDLWSRGDKGGRSAIKGVILCTMALTPFIVLTSLWLTVPSIYDVSSDMENPPLAPFTLIATRPSHALPFLEDFSDQTNAQMASWPDLSGRRYNSSPDKILKAVETVLQYHGWPGEDVPNSIGDEAEILVTTQARIPVLGFISDVIIRLHDEEEATQVDMRITSRDLPHDFGFGAYSILEFMQDLDREVLLGGMEQTEDD